MSIEKRIPLLNALRAENGTLETDRFTLTTADAEVTVHGTATVDAPCYRLLGYDEAQNEILIFEKNLSLGANGAFSYVHSFDPTSLAVYQNAVAFRVRILPPASGADFTVATLDLVEYEQTAEELSQSLAPRKKQGPKELKKVLFVGNSILLGIENRYGMCASAPDRDYAFHVSEAIKKKYPSCEFYKIHGSCVEHSESVEEFESIYYNEPNPYTGAPFVDSLDPELDLIILQITDNVNTEKKVEVFDTTAELLLSRIRARCPNVTILWAHGWYYKKAIQKRLMELIKQYDVESVDLRPLRFRANEAPEGALYLSANGSLLPAKSLWLSHPGDRGMAAIADKMISVLKEIDLL